MPGPAYPSGDRAPQQAAAIPFRHRGGAVEICLITTVKARRWTIPKGFIEPGATAPETAVREAREEAGIHGRVVGGPVGYYDIAKQGGRYRVVVYLMHVDRVDDAWEEQALRQRRWVSARRAEKLLAGRPLEAVFRQASRRIVSKEPS